MQSIRSFCFLATFSSALCFNFPNANSRCVDSWDRTCSKSMGRRPLMMQTEIIQNGIEASSSIIPNGAVVDEFTKSFVDTFSAKVAGAIFANIIAGVLIKLITDLFTRKPDVDLGKPDRTDEIAPTIKISNGAWLKLILCVTIDLVGDSSFVFPGVGELEDVVWAPISSYILYQLFESNVVSTLEFAKEILPFTDVIPLATLIWSLENVFVNTPVNKFLNIPKKP